jgi:hypothetical protein
VDIPPIPERLLRLAKKYKPLPTDEELIRIKARQKIKARLDSSCRMKKKKKKTSTIQVSLCQKYGTYIHEKVCQIWQLSIRGGRSGKHVQKLKTLL